MRRLIVVAATATALAVPSSALANASPIGGGAAANAVGSVQGGKNNQSQQYKASYADPFFGRVSCSGVHQSGKTLTPLGQDSFTCTTTSGSALTNVHPGQSLSLSTFGGWYSDYYNLLGRYVLARSFTGTVSSDGKSYTAIANY